MLENKEEYEAILKEKVIILEGTLDRPIHHGDIGYCPKCRAIGNFDLEGLGFSPGPDISIYYSTVFNEWRCQHCDFETSY